MDDTWLDSLEALIPIACAVVVVILTIAAGLAVAKLRRWSLACLFVAGLLMSNFCLCVIFGYMNMQGGISFLFYFLMLARYSDLVWLPALVGGLGEAVWFIRKSSK